MPSQDLLAQLYEVELAAKRLVAEAGAEAARRRAEAREAVEREQAARREAARARVKVEIDAAQKAIDLEFRSIIDGYRLLLDRAPLDEKAFRALCERKLAEGAGVP